LLLQFSLTTNLRWRTEIPGKGWSSPVVADGRIWVTTAITSSHANAEGGRREGTPDEVTFRALAVDASTGKLVHRIELGTSADPQSIHPLNTYASPTPVLSAGRVFCDFGNYGTWCLDGSTGEKLWHRKFVVDYEVGPGSSPVVCGDLLVLVCDGGDQQFIVALNQASGEVVWKTPRPPIRAESSERRKSFSTPLVIEVAGAQQIVVPGAQWIAGYDPTDGREIWRVDHGSGFSLSARPVFSQGLVIFSTGYMKPELVAVRPDGQGDVSESHIAWRATRGAPNKPSPIVVGDRLYSIADNGVLTQFRVADGTEVWRERLGSEYSASPVAAGDRIYFSAHDGSITVIGAGDRFERLAENQLEGRLMASPAVVGRDLIIRSEQALMRIGE
jgi:hypothetical protein